MKIETLGIEGAFKISPQVIGDSRGAFARVYCAERFRAHGLQTEWVQMNTSRNSKAGTVRGLHFQKPPFAEVKLVRCVKGRVFDVFVDLRAGSKTYGRSCSVELDATNLSSVYIPSGCAHGFQTLTDDAELHYCHSQPYEPEYEGGVNMFDDDLEISWPLPFSNVSERDKGLPSLKSIEPVSL